MINPNSARIDVIEVKISSNKKEVRQVLGVVHF